MLSRKHYKAIAEIIEDQAADNSTIYKHCIIVPRSGLVYRLANYFAADNPRFDRERFLEACGLE